MIPSIEIIKYSITTVQNGLQKQQYKNIFLTLKYLDYEVSRNSCKYYRISKKVDTSGKTGPLKIYKKN